MLEAIDYAARSLDDAVQLGLLTRTKITGRWLYAASVEAREAATSAVESAVTKQLQAWLLGAIPFLRGPVSRSVSKPVVTAGGVELLIHALVHRGRIGVLPLMTNEYEPYLGLYSPEDATEVERQVKAMRTGLSKHGCITATDLPEPAQPRDGKAWRSTILRHGEYLGLGRMDQGSLITWEMADGA
jgi:hypothetical protein